MLPLVSPSRRAGTSGVLEFSIPPLIRLVLFWTGSTCSNLPWFSRDWHPKWYTPTLCMSLDNNDTAATRLTPSTSRHYCQILHISFMHGGSQPATWLQPAGKVLRYESDVTVAYCAVTFGT